MTHSIIPLSLVALVGLCPTLAHALTTDCQDATGTCTVGNDPEDAVECDCGDFGFGAAGGDQWASLDLVGLAEVCAEQLESCAGGSTDGGYGSDDGGPPGPGIACETENAVCVVSNSPEDWMSCECLDGSGTGGFGGGNAWAGLDDAALFEVCVSEAANFCQGSVATEGGDDDHGPCDDGDTDGAATSSGQSGSGDASGSGSSGVYGEDDGAADGGVDPRDLPFGCNVSDRRDTPPLVLGLGLLLGLAHRRRRSS